MYATVTAGRGPRLARKFAICVSARDGKLICQEIREVEASFDEESGPPEKPGEKTGG